MRSQIHVWVDSKVKREALATAQIWGGSLADLVEQGLELKLKDMESKGERVVRLHDWHEKDGKLPIGFPPSSQEGQDG